MIKYSLKLASTLLLMLFFIEAISLLSKNADENFEKVGAYTSELLTWEQNTSGEGRLILIGHPIKVDLDRIASLKDELSLFIDKILSRTST